MALLEVGGDINWFVPDTLCLPIDEEESAPRRGLFVTVLAQRPTDSPRAERLCQLLVGGQPFPCVIYAPHCHVVGRFFLSELEYVPLQQHYRATFILTGPLQYSDGRPVAGINELGSFMKEA